MIEMYKRNKLIILTCLFIMCFLVCLPNVLGETSDNIFEAGVYNSPKGDGTVSCFEDTGDISLRNTPGGTKNGGTLSCGDVVTIHSSQEGNASCPYYLNVTNQNNESGYTCGIYINTTKLTSFAQNYYNNNGGVEAYYNILRKVPFPESYLPYLAEIHARHPNWNFEREVIGINYSDVVENESYSERNLLQDGAFDSNYYSMKYQYDILKNEFYYSSEYSFFNASSEAIAYFLDPRTYLNEKYIFAFEALDFKPNQTASAVMSVIGGTAFEGNNTFSQEMVNAGQTAGVSALHLASSFKQEMAGVGFNDPRLGGPFTYGGANLSGYYNLFNIKSSCTNCSNIYAGYAYEKGWNTTYKALEGGARFLATNYIAVNQDTMYYKKFDVSTTDGHYTHQFMQNLSAIAAETTKTYNAYVNKLSNYLNTSITFTIPVYYNMTNYHITSPKLGNPNNYLKDLKVDGTTLSGFSYDKYNYNITVPAGTGKINIAATPVASTTTVSGANDVTLTSDNQVVNVVARAANSRTRTYTINVKRENGTVPDLSVILNSSGVKYNGSYMYGIAKNTAVTSLINNVTSLSGYARINIYNKNGGIKNSGVFATGDKVVIGNTVTNNTYNVALYGDITGDGAIDKLDFLAILRHYYGYTSYSGVYKFAADINKDGRVDKLDALAVLRDYYGYASINQNGR